MLRTFSQLFAPEKDGKRMAGPLEEASTAPGSDCASDGADASIPSDCASDASAEALAPNDAFEPGVEADRSRNEGAAQPPVCAQAVPGDVVEERAGNGGPCMEIAVPNASSDDADVARGSPVRRPTPASQTADGQAKRRALKRYRQDASGQWVKGRAGDDVRWLPEPGATAFPTLELAMENERHKTVMRRASWANLRGEVAGTRKAVTEEGVRTRHHQSREAEETRRSVEEARDSLAAKVEEGVKALCAQERKHTLDSSSPSKISFYSNVFSNLRARDMKDLLMSRDIEPVGAKSMLAQLVVAHLTQEEVEQFVIVRSDKRRRIDVPSSNQQRLDVLFNNAETGRVA